MYSFSYLEPVCSSMSSSNCCFLTCIQVSQEAGRVVWYSHLFQNFPQFIVIHRVKGFGIVNKAEIDVFLELSCFFHDPADVGNLVSRSSAFTKTSLNIWKFTVHVPLKLDLKNLERYFTSAWDECNCAVVWAWSRGATPRPRPGRSRDELLHARGQGDGQEELLHPWGRGSWARGATPCPRSGGAAVKRYPSSKVK